MQQGRRPFVARPAREWSGAVATSAFADAFAVPSKSMRTLLRSAGYFSSSEPSMGKEAKTMAVVVGDAEP
jgi:hypothetical protein